MSPPGGDAMEVGGGGALAMSLVRCSGTVHAGSCHTVSCKPFP